MTRVRAVAVALAGVLGLVAGCGVEVPDDVAADIEASTTTVEVPRTTETPTSDDALEQALIDNGYTLEEARCGAANLRGVLDDTEVRSIIDADTIEDISGATARDFAAALRPCVEDGAGTEGSSPPDGRGPGGVFGGGLPGFGDDSEGDVSRSRFLAALISAGLDDEAARCVVERAYDELDQDDVNALFHAESVDDVDPDLAAAFDRILTACMR